jgi:hypothetical protein
MIYVEDTLNLMPASPETIESFVSLSEEQLVPNSERLGARLVAAWSSNADAFGQVINVWEFDDLGALGAFRANGASDEAWLQCQQQIEELAPGRSARIMEALGPVPAEVLREAGAASQHTQLGVYSMAILQVAPGKMAAFKAGLEASTNLPIIASWLTIGGRQNEVTDIWKGTVGQGAYEPPDDSTKQFFRGLRTLAPNERIKIVYPLPYSPLL